MRMLYRRFALLVLVLLLIPAPASAASKGLLWSVEGKGCTVWLLGSIHLADASLYPLSRSITDAFEASSILVVEADVSVPLGQEAAEVILEAQYPAGKSLYTEISAEIIQAYADQGIDLAPYKTFRPWFATMALGIDKIMELGFDPAYGVDIQLITMAKQRGMEVLELEGVVQQLRSVQFMDNEDPDLLMQYTLDDLGSIQADMQLLMNAWKNGDDATMEERVFRSLRENPETRPFYESLFFDRNKTMAEKIFGYLKSGQDHFVVVGSGHLIGAESIIDILEQRDFRVEKH